MQSILNKKAKHDYEILETYEAGLVLHGHEVKSIKNGQMNLKGSYITIKNERKPSVWLVNAHIPLYKKASNLEAYDPYRSRKLLLHKKEIQSLIGRKTAQPGLTFLPLKVYNKNNRLKLEFGLGKGKKKFDKRADLKKRDIDKKMRQLKKNLM